MIVPAGAGAVMASRLSSKDALDAFWTPPWGTRALCHYIFRDFRDRLPGLTAWDPACGMGLMSDSLTDYFGAVHASDVHDHGMGCSVGSFIGEGADAIGIPDGGVDWIITNPPFKIATEFAERAIPIARKGVALLCRAQWIESAERFKLFSQYPLSCFAPFSGRLPMVQGRWDPEASSATSYAWFVFCHTMEMRDWRVSLIPPAAEDRLTKADDAARFAPWTLKSDNPARIEALARKLCPDPDKLISASLSDTLTYRERREQKKPENKEREPKDRRKVVRVSAWMARRREADDIIANNLITARRAKEAA